MNNVALDLEAIKTRCEAARCEVNRLCQGRTSWTMSVPVRDDDTDVILTDSFRDIPALVTRVKRLRCKLHDERVRRDEWEEMYYQAIAGTEVERLQECLEMAMEALSLYTEGSTDGVPAQGVLAEIGACLAESEPHDETLTEVERLQTALAQAESIIRVHEHALNERDKILAVLAAEHRLRWKAQRRDDASRLVIDGAHEALDECRIERNYGDGRPASVRTRILWLEQLVGNERRLQQEAELAAHVHDKSCGELAQTVHTERQLRREAEQRAERAEALAALVTPELAVLLEQLAIHVPYTFHTGTGTATQARSLAARIREALEKTRDEAL